MITGRRPGRADAAQRLPEKTLQSRRVWQSGRTVCFAVRGCDRASPPVAPKPSAASPPATRSLPPPSASRRSPPRAARAAVSWTGRSASAPASSTGWSPSTPRPRPTRPRPLQRRTRRVGGSSATRRS